jgi:hypothetical protein
MDEGVSLRDYIDVQLKELRHRLHESATDRQHIRDALAGLVPRTEYDRVLGQALDRINALERTVSRIYGGIAVVVLALSMIGIILRVVLG